MTTLRLVAAGNPTKSPDGALGLLVFLGLVVLIVFLFRSMNKHLRKAAATKFDDAAQPPAATTPAAAQPKTKGGRRQGRPADGPESRS